jgi:four helix bundle protein
MATEENRPIRSFKHLVAWRKGMDLVASVYEATAGFPSAERFGLTMQVRRSAVSVPSNIAEGYGRRSRRDYVRFLDIASSSANELETQLLLAERLGLGGEATLAPALELTREVQRLVSGLSDAVERSGKTGRRH